MNMEQPNTTCACGEPIGEKRVALGCSTCLKCAEKNPGKDSLGVDSSGKIYNTDLGKNLEDIKEKE